MKMLGGGLKFCVSFFLREDNYFLKGKSKLFNSFTEPCFFNTFVSIADLFAVPYLCDAYKCNEDKCCVLTNRLEDILLASLGLFTWLVYVRTYCVPITTLNQNKRFRLLYRPNNNNYCKRDIRGGWHKFLLEKVLITCSVVAIKTYQT